MKKGLATIMIAIILIGLVAAGVTAVYVLKPNIGGIQFAAGPTGFTTLSLSQASFQSTNTYFNNPKMWIMTIAQGGMGQSATGSISCSQIGTVSGTKCKNDLSISISESKFDWEYPIKVDYSTTPIYKYTLQTWSSFGSPTQTDAKNHCAVPAMYGQFGGLSFTAYCVDEQQVSANMGYLDSCNLHTISTFTVNGASKTIDSTNQISSYIGTNAYVIWNGNLVKQNCPTSSPYRAWYSNGWKLGYDSQYQTYKINQQNLLNSLSQLQSGSLSQAGLQTLINNVNSASTIFSGNTATFTGGSLSSMASLNSAYYDIPVTTDSQVPTYTLYVSADVLGIYQPTPSPQIQSCQGTTFKTGDNNANVFVTFKNIGDSGNFQVWYSCSSPFQFTGTTKTVSVNAGSLDSEYLSIGASATTHIAGTCTISVQAVGTSDIKTCDVNVAADPQQVCTPNAVQCTPGNTMQKCNGAGSGWDNYQSCGANQNCGYENGVAKCIDKNTPIIPVIPGPTPNPTPSPNPGECQPILWIIPNVPCMIQNWWNGVLAWFAMVALIVAILVGIVSIPVSYSNFKKMLGRKNQKAALILSMVISVIVLLLIYYLFWLGVVLLMIYFIVIFLIGHFLPAKKYFS